MFKYRPALRFKEGEYVAIGKISPQLAKYVVPYFILPPLIEKDPELKRLLTSDELAYVTAKRVSKNWPFNPAYIDAQYIQTQLSEQGLLRLFNVARNRNSKLIAIVPFRDILNPVWKQLLLSDLPKLAIHIPFDQFDASALKNGIKFLGVRAEECEIFVDFTGAELEPSIAADVVTGILIQLAEVAPWLSIVFQASNFPSKNPAAPGSDFAVPRFEWALFKRILSESGIPSSRLGYSDFGADSGHIKFPTKTGGAIAIPHIRYCVEDSIIIIRGPDNGNQSANMRGVMQRLVNRSDFSGRTLSYADNRFWNIAKGNAGAGTPTMWREWNMAHHMARVIHDLGKLLGVEFINDFAVASEEQKEFFPVKT